MTQDANTAALAKKEREDAANDAIVDAYQARAIEELVDAIMCGEKCEGWSRIDFVDILHDDGGILIDDITALIFAKDDALYDVRDRLSSHVEQRIKVWLTDSVAGQGAVSDLCHELAADDAERHKEERLNDE